MSDFLAETVDRHTDAMPSWKKWAAMLVIAAIAIHLAFRG